MSRIKVSKTASVNDEKERKEWPAVVYLWTLGLALLSYLIARFVLDAYPHTYHWSTGAEMSSSSLMEKCVVPFPTMMACQQDNRF
jgi:hypothetical protein